MSLRDSLGRYVPFLRPRSPLARADMLTLRPVRNPAVIWETRERMEDGEDGDDTEVAPGVLLTIPRRTDRMGRILSFWFQMPEGRTVELDEFGTEVWGMCDGEHTVEQLVRHTCDAYKLNRRQGEVSVVAFMRMLAQRRLVGFKVGGTADHGSRESVRPVGRKRPKRAGGARRRR